MRPLASPRSVANGTRIITIKAITSPEYGTGQIRHTTYNALVHFKHVMMRDPEVDQTEETDDKSKERNGDAFQSVPSRGSRGFELQRHDRHDDGQNRIGE